MISFRDKWGKFYKAVFHDKSDGSMSTKTVSPKTQALPFLMKMLNWK